VGRKFSANAEFEWKTLEVPFFEEIPITYLGESMALMTAVIWAFSVILFKKSGESVLVSLCTARSWRYTLAGSFLGAYVAMVLWIGGMKYTQASTAAALNQSSNIFVFLFAALFLKEKITLLRAGAIVTAVIGVLLVTFG
jgi:drug/metabolite transporter (DMT)-like permease